MGVDEFFIIVKKLMNIDTQTADDFLKLYEEHLKEQ